MKTDLTSEEIAELETETGKLHGIYCRTGPSPTIDFSHRVSFIGDRKGDIGSPIAVAVATLVRAAPQLLAMARRTVDAQAKVLECIAAGAEMDRTIAELERRLAEAKAAMVELLAATDIELTTHSGLSVSRIMRIGSARRAARAALDATQPEPEQG